MILALDLATVTGWAAASMDTPPIPAPIETLADFRFECASGFKRFPGGQDVDAGMLLDRYDEFLHDLIAVHAPTLIMYEAALPTHSGSSAGEKLIGMATHTEFVGRRSHVRVMKAHNATVVKHAVGTGRDSGKRLRAERARKLGWGSMDNNEIDARYVLSYALLTLQGARRTTT